MEQNAWEVLDEAVQKFDSTLSYFWIIARFYRRQPKLFRDLLVVQTKLAIFLLTTEAIARKNIPAYLPKSVRV